MSYPVNIKNSYEDRVNLGLISGASVFISRGYNPDLDIGTEEVNPLGLSIVLPASAFTAVLVSTSASDAYPAGTGALIVLLEGLNATYDVTTEFILMNGITGVNSVNTYIRIRRLTVVTSGTSQTNAGQITASLNSNFQQIMAAGSAISETLSYTSPRGKSVLIHKYQIQCIKPGSGTPQLTVASFAKIFGTNTLVRNVLSQIDTATSGTFTDFITYTTPLPEKSDVITQATTTVNNTVVYIVAIAIEYTNSLLPTS